MTILDTTTTSVVLATSLPTEITTVLLYTILHRATTHARIQIMYLSFVTNKGNIIETITETVRTKRNTNLVPNTKETFLSMNR